MSSSPPEGFEVRPLRPEDAAAAAQLLRVFDTTYLPEDAGLLGEQDVLDWWRRHDLPHDSVGLSHEGSLAGVGLLELRDELELEGFVHPDWGGRGLGSFLLSWAEERARERSAPRLRTPIVPGDVAARPLVESRGYDLVRHFYRMVIDFDAPMPEPIWPDGFSVSALAEGEERLLYEVIEEAFAEEWGRPERSFEDWERNVLAQESFDPALCFLVREGDQVAAAETCAQRFGLGWIGAIGVRKPWRRRGLGRALLLHGFAELYSRGERRAGLGVDASNPTGATELYGSAGMRIAWQADLYERAL